MNTTSMADEFPDEEQQVATYLRLRLYADAARLLDEGAGLSRDWTWADLEPLLPHLEPRGLVIVPKGATCWAVVSASEAEGWVLSW